MRNSKRKKAKINWHIKVKILAFMLIAPLILQWFFSGSISLTKTGETVALIAASVQMPESGIALLRERFEQELYQPENPQEPNLIIPEIQQPQNPITSPFMPEQSAPNDNSIIEKDQPKTAPKIPNEFKAAIITENFAGVNSTALISYLAGFIKNDTTLSNEKVSAILESPFPLELFDTKEPQVLIVHTHATESFERFDNEFYDTRNTWRSRDNNLNIVSVGAAMAEVLEENSISVIHDTTQHDYPSYNGSYERSAETIQKYLDKYPSIKIVLDVHRDAMERDNLAIIKPTSVIDGKKAAQVMIIAACDNQGSLGVPEYKKNLRFAAELQNYMESDYKDLTRPIFFAYRKYNMDLSVGSLLIEFGSNANTHDEAIYSGKLAGQALSNLIKDYMK